MNAVAIVGLEWLGTLALFLVCLIAIRYMRHRERMSMIERGLMPDEHIAHAPRSGGILRGGLITALTGLAITMGLYNLGYLLPPPFNAAPGRIGPWLLPGLIPTAVGVALIASYYLAPPRIPSPQNQDGEEASGAPHMNMPAHGPHLLHNPEVDAESDSPHTRDA